MPPSCRSCPVLLPLLAAALLAGCAAPAPRAASTPPTAPQPPAALVIAVPVRVAPPAPADTAPPTPGPVAPVLAQIDQILRLAPADLAREITRLGEAEDAAPETPLLLATALGQTRQGPDTARALGLAQRVLANGSPSAQALHPLARLLEARLVQQRRLEEQLDRQAQQLRDAQRRNDQLNERLEAVRAIERSLTTRPPAVPAPPASAPAGSAQRPAS